MNKYTLIITLIINLIFIITLFTILNIKKRKNEDTKIELVVSRYNENLEWLKNEPFNKYPVICYNKGPNENFYKPNNMKVVKLENLGRDYGTFMYHIINNYDNLSKYTFFLPGSLQLPNKYDRAKNWLIDFEKNTVNMNKYCKYYENGILDEQKNFVMNQYKSSDPQNHSINTSIYIYPSDKKPFSKWYKYHFNDKKINHICYNGIFLIDRDSILKNPISYYNIFLNELNKHSNTEVIHYMERAFSALFN